MDGGGVLTCLYSTFEPVSRYLVFCVLSNVVLERNVLADDNSNSMHLRRYIYLVDA